MRVDDACGDVESRLLFPVLLCSWLFADNLQLARLCEGSRRLVRLHDTDGDRLWEADLVLLRDANEGNLLEADLRFFLELLCEKTEEERADLLEADLRFFLELLREETEEDRLFRPIALLVGMCLACCLRGERARWRNGNGRKAFHSRYIHTVAAPTLHNQKLQKYKQMQT